MKISLCIPQYNRIKFLLYNLEEIAKQKYENIEVVISDDGSTDNTVEEIERVKLNYRFPIIFYRQPSNQGYDKNLRTSIELATGDYVIILGNDDTINPAYDLLDLVLFLNKNNLPDVGFTNFINAETGNTEYRAANTEILGNGPEVAFRHYSRSSFVGGLIYKHSTYMKYNSPKFDGSVYTQMYHCSLIVADGGVLFSIVEPVVVKDILPHEQNRSSYTDNLHRRWSEFKVVNGGLPSVLRVLISAFEDANVLTQERIYGIFRKMYGTTFPFWILTYRKDKAMPEAVGLAIGMKPGRVTEFSRLNWKNRIKINMLYTLTSVSALIIPIIVFEKMKTRLWHMANNVKA